MTGEQLEQEDTKLRESSPYPQATSQEASRINDKRQRRRWSERTALPGSGDRERDAWCLDVDEQPLAL